MSPAEVLHRFHELALKRAWRSRRDGWTSFEGFDAGPIAEFPLLRARMALALPHLDAALQDTRARRYHGLGHVFDGAAHGPVWFHDPVGNTRWPGPETYCFDCNVRSDGTVRGDVKFVWEINRLQMLHPLAVAIAAKADPADIDLAFAILADWQAANPPFRGINWFSGIELAMRMVSLTLIVAAMPAGGWTDERRALITRMVTAYGFWLHRYPSRFSSANNHLVAEGLGLLLAGMVLPRLADAPEWRAEGRRILETEASLQIFADGVGAEQSPTYQAFTMEMLAFADLVAGSAGQPLSGIVRERLIAGATFLRALMDTAGRCPAIGDDDEGRVLAQPPDREPRYVASVVAMVAGCVGDPALAPPARDPHLRDALFAVPEKPETTPSGLHVFAEGGYSIGRCDQGSVRSVLVFDHGPLGYLSLAAHGHADALAIWLSVGDQPVIVDAGTYLYHSGGTTRNMLRSSQAHNTVTVNGASQSRPSAAFSWSSKARGQLTQVCDEEWFSVTATHDGYRGRYGLIHERQIERRPNGFAVTDRLVGATRLHEAEVGFLIHPDLEVQPNGHWFRILGPAGPLVDIVGPDSLKPLIIRADASSGQGFFSPRFGELRPARRIVFAGDLGADPVVTQIVIAGS
ncbi:MAG TPA: alginate lyase family protein [Beijerinckiaceae bacterium]|nr:alginate lyase family protein [Beijerinckiaceae bacterium]